MQTCYRHPSRETGVSCSNCGRPICTDCMTPTNVGMRCPECSKQKTKVVHARSIGAVDPQVTKAIIFVNVAIFFGLLLSGGNGLNSRAGFLYENGVLNGFAVHDGEWWRLVTAGFLHAGITHVLFNMVGVWFLGQLIEPAVGTVRYLALYFTALLVGSFGALLESPEANTVGASGAVFGLMGAAVVLLRRSGVDPMRSGILPILLLNLLITFTLPGISIGGHIGGLVGGLVCAWIIAATDRRGALTGRRLGVVGCFAVAALAVAGSLIAAGTPSLYFT